MDWWVRGSVGQWVGVNEPHLGRFAHGRWVMPFAESESPLAIQEIRLTDRLTDRPTDFRHLVFCRGCQSLR